MRRSEERLHAVMENRTILARIVFAILLGIFVWKCTEAVIKYKDPGKGQRISVEDHDKIDFPTLAICPVLRETQAYYSQGGAKKRYNDTSRSVEGLADAYEKAPPVHEVFPVVHYFLKEEDVYDSVISDSVVNLAVQEEVEARTNISFNDLWTVKVVLPGEYCYIFNAPEKIRPSLIIGLNFVHDFDKYSSLRMAVVNPDSFLYMPRSFYGSDVVELFWPNYDARVANQTWRMDYSVSICNYIRIDEGHTKDEEKTISECVKNFLGLNCELPWEARRAGMSDNVCNSTDDTKRYYDLMRELQWDMTLPKFIEKTKCLLKSNFSQYRLEVKDQRWENFSKNEGHRRASVWMKTISPTIQTIEEIYLYTGSDLLADIGGYLGLLLGVSAFTVYTTIEELLRAFKCSTHCNCHDEVEENEMES